MPVTIYGEVPGLTEFIANLNDVPYRRRVIYNVLRAASAEIARLAVAKLRPHRRTGETGAGVIPRAYETPLGAVIGVHNLTGLFLEKGTKAHMITARAAQALMLPVRAGMAQQQSRMGFEVTSPFGRTYGKSGSSRLTGSVRSGQLSFFRSVNHPGTRPMPFLLPAFHESLPMIDLLILKAGAQIVHKMARKGELSV